MVMVTGLDAVTMLVFAVKDVLVAPCEMVTLAGTVTTPGLLLERETRTPPFGAGPLSVTVPIEGVGPTKVRGLSVSEVRVGPAGGCGVTFREAVCITPELAAEIVTAAALAVVMVETWKAAPIDPAATVTLAGTVATEVLLLDKEKTMPPLGAGLLRVICPVEGFPPLTLVGLSVSENEIGPGGGCGVTVRGAVCVKPELEAEIVTVVELAVVMVGTWKTAPIDPAATVTLAGTVANEVSLLDKEKMAPPLGAGLLSAICPVEAFPPLTLVGLSVSENGIGPGGGWGVTVREAVCVTPELAAEIVTVVELAVVMVDTWKTAPIDPAATVTLAGTVATEVLLLDKEKTVPPLGAGLLRVICPVEDFPPLTLAGFSVSENGVEEDCGEDGEGVLTGAAAPPHEYE